MKKSKQSSDVTSRGAISPFLVFLLILLIILIAIFIFGETTSRPSYCSRCHAMKPYFDSWKESSHSKVGCVKCHYAAGTNMLLKAKFIGVRMYFKNATSNFQGRRPWAEVENSACKRPGCHIEPSLPEKIDLKGVQFAHLQHLNSSPRGKRLSCTSCHAEMVHYSSMAASVGTCYLCHFMPVKGQTIVSTYTSECKFCHTPPKGIIKRNGIEVNHEDAFTASLECTRCHQLVTSGDGSASTERCILCHADPDVIDRYNEISVIHDSHVTSRNMECSRCHSPIKHKMPSIGEPVATECTVCHIDYHTDSARLYNAFSFTESDNYSSPEFMSHIECKACHFQAQPGLKGVTFIANSQACIKCHHSRFGNFLEEWKLATSNLINEVRAELTIAKGKIDDSSLSAKRKEEINKKLNDASLNINIVERGKGVHNIRFSDTLIRQAHDSLNSVLREIGAQPIHSDKIEAYRFASSQECTGCHYGTAVYTSMFGDISFSHIPHLAKGKVSCISCHEYKTRWEPHGKLKFTDSEGCKKCHGAGKGCQSCHSGFEQKPISVFDKTFIHAPHIEGAQMMCLDCHSAESENIAHGKLILQKASDCTSCHHGTKQTRQCADCHSIQSAIEEAKVPGIDESMRTIITHKFHCSKCHDMTQKQTRTAIAEKCTGCHDDSYVKYIDQWQINAKEVLTEIDNLIKRAQQLELSDDQKEELKRITEKHEYLMKETNPGVHNPDLWKAILDKDRKTMRRWLGEQ